MADQQAANLNGNTPASITINAQYVRDMSFENPNAPGIYLPQQDDKDPTLELLVNVQTRVMGENIHEVILTMKATSKAGEKVGFIAELSYAGLFSTATGAEAAEFLAGHRLTTATVPAMSQDPGVRDWEASLCAETCGLLQRLRSGLRETGAAGREVEPRE